MNMPLAVYKLALYTLVTIGGLAILYYTYRRRAAPANLPRAEIKGGSLRSLLVPWIPFASLVLGLGGAALLYGHGYDVVRVIDGEHGPSAERWVRLGKPVWSRVKPSPYGDSDDTWIVNASSVPVRVENRSYGSSFGLDDTPYVLAPGDVASESHVDYLGPSDPPPSSLEVTGVEAKLKMSLKTWVTW